VDGVGIAIVIGVGSGDGWARFWAGMAVVVSWEGMKVGVDFRVRPGWSCGICGIFRWCMGKCRRRVSECLG